ncbi:rhomboid family intramembrane serine protease [Vallitalea okinawensis]|uniref:rhomboid family intramembrane serine protease n=1 Tax=Vallitalea okinawensis TaxID=2078660 RepID=UPI000CFE2FA6|nr:rhomboid family intramembrane serine protease [Vallitalea okinawensis]
MIKDLMFQFKKKVPIVSILLILSCILSTVPQFFLPVIYSDIASQKATAESFYLFTLSSFTHSPGMLGTHLIGNLLAFLLFGVLAEMLIGSKRFAFITVLTFFSTTLVSYLHTTSRFLGHGASGIAWGYHTFFILIIIILYEHKGKRLFKDIYIILSILLLIFDLFGIPIFEVLVKQQGFFENFGQVLHLISIIVVIPFAFLWRKDIENNVMYLISQKSIQNHESIKRISLIILIVLLVLNAYGTIKVASIAKNDSKHLSYEVIQGEEPDITAIPQKIIIKFESEIEEAYRSSHSISYNEEPGTPQISESLIDPYTLEITFNRLFEDGEKMELTYDITGELVDNILFKEELVLVYQ